MLNKSFFDWLGGSGGKSRESEGEAQLVLPCDFLNNCLPLAAIESGSSIRIDSWDVDNPFGTGALETWFPGPSASLFIENCVSFKWYHLIRFQLVTKEFNCNFYQLQNIAENPALRILCILFGNINFSSSQLTLPFSVITSLLFYVIQIKLLFAMNIHRCLLVPSFCSQFAWRLRQLRFGARRLRPCEMQSKEIFGCLW